MSFDMAIQLTWTSLSFVAVILALLATNFAKDEARETKEERSFQRSRRAKNGLLILAEQQASQAYKLLWAHRMVYIHQSLFFFAGFYALFSPSLPEPEHLPTIRSVAIPVSLVAAQFVIVGMQLVLFQVTREQRRARKEWGKAEDSEATEHLQASVDEGVGVARDTNERIRDMQEQGNTDRGEERIDREEGREHRKAPPEGRE